MNVSREPFSVDIVTSILLIVKNIVEGMVPEIWKPDEYFATQGSRCVNPSTDCGVVFVSARLVFSSVIG